MRMLDHLSIQCADLDVSAAFYDAVLVPVGGKRILDFGPVIGYGTDFPCFWIGAQTTGSENREVHIAFTAPTRAAVDEFVRIAESSGAEVLHPPRVWPEYHEHYYGGFVRDPDGNNVEAVCHTPAE
jgi:catechol 2,3-dioxygenase-like lactoylglutathione lyase family enzyme